MVEPVVPALLDKLALPPKAVEVAAERAMKPAGTMCLKALKHAVASEEAVAHRV